MIRAFYGIEVNPFDRETDMTLLPHQQEIYDILQVHSHQGGFCLLMGDPGTGKTVIKTTINKNADKRTLVVNVSRTLHTYINTIKILCQAFNIEYEGSYFKCEKRLIEEAYTLNKSGRTIVIVIDDAHLLEMTTMRRLRLLFEDFPKNHNIILVGQVELIHKMALRVNDDLKNRVTYSVIIKKLNPDDMDTFITSQLDRAGLPHNVFSEDAQALIVRSCDGNLRKARNLALSCLLEGVRTGKKTIGIDAVNRVLIQPHWRIDSDTQLISSSS